MAPSLPVLSVRLRCQNSLEFSEVIAPRYAQSGFFARVAHPPPVGSHVDVRFHLAGADVALAGEAVVVQVNDSSDRRGMTLRLIRLEVPALPPNPAAPRVRPPVLAGTAGDVPWNELAAETGSGSGAATKTLRFAGSEAAAKLPAHGGAQSGGATHAVPRAPHAAAPVPTESDSEHFAALETLRFGQTETFLEPPDEPTLKPGHVLGKYRVTSLLGEGSMAHVYLARHAQLGRQVAIKVLRPELLKVAGEVRRFFDEARIVNQINHPHIVEIIDFVQERGTEGPTLVYLVMELLTGRSLAAALRQGPQSVSGAAVIARSVCQAVGAAHRLAVVHRDLKPDNIFLTERDGFPDYVKVLDFGIAKLGRARPETQVRVGGTGAAQTTVGTIVGTPQYMAPEQAAGLGAIPQSDVYAIGTILYEMLAGTPPFSAPTVAQLAMRVVVEPPPPLGKTTVGGEPLPDALRALIERCLQKEPSARPASMEEVAAALEPFAAPEVPTVRARGLSRAAILAIAITGLLAAAGAAGYRWWSSRRAAQTALARGLAEVDERVAGGRLVGPGGDQALDRLIAATRLAPQEPAVRERQRLLAEKLEGLGDALLAGGDPAEAAAYYQAAAQAEPGRQAAQEKLRRAQEQMRQRLKDRASRGR